MINIAMYIANKDSAAKIRSAVCEYLKTVKEVFVVKTYDDPRGMARCIEENDTDIYIIDFASVKNATILVNKLRKINISSAVVIINTSVEVLKKYLYIRPSGFVETLDDIHSLTETIVKIKSDTYFKNRYFMFKCEGEIMRIPYDKICYFESNARKVTLSCFDSETKYSFMAKLDDIQSKLPENFLRCHQSYLLNMGHVAKLDKTAHSFFLFNNEEVFISRRMYAEAVKQYEKFSGNKSAAVNMAKNNII